MDVRSLGFRTDLALLTASGSLVEDRGTHLVVRTPANPAYFWGNFLLLAEPPVPGGEREVIGAFRTEFPEAEHVAIGIDGPDLPEDSRAAFEDAGMTVDVASVLTTTELVAPRDVDAEIRPLASDEDWEARAQLTRAYTTGVRDRALLTFERARNQQERDLAAAGRGERFGVFVDGALVSTAAVYRTEDEVARYQTVETHPDHRRGGFAAAAVHAAGRHALDALGARTLVIVADADGEAARLYGRLGFVESERQLALEQRSGAWADLAER